MSLSSLAPSDARQGWLAALQDGSILASLAWDLALLLLFVVQHSLMATEVVKAWTSRYFGVLQRSLYVACTALALQVGCLARAGMMRLHWGTKCELEVLLSARFPGATRCPVGRGDPSPQPSESLAALSALPCFVSLLRSCLTSHLLGVKGRPASRGSLLTGCLARPAPWAPSSPHPARSANPV